MAANKFKILSRRARKGEGMIAGNGWMLAMEKGRKRVFPDRCRRQVMPVTCASLYSVCPITALGKWWATRDSNPELAD